MKSISWAVCKPEQYLNQTLTSSAGLVPLASTECGRAHRKTIKLIRVNVCLLSSFVYAGVLFPETFTIH